MKSFFSGDNMIIANGGGFPQLPPGSAVAMDEAVKSGVDIIHIMLFRTKDRLCVAGTEKNTVGLTGLKGRIGDYTLAELVKEDGAGMFDPAGDGTFPFRGRGIRMLTLEEILTMYPEQKFSFELMDRGMAGEFCAEVEKACAAERVMAGSPHGADLREIRKRLPSVATSFSPMGFVAVYALFRSGLLYFFRKFSADVLMIPEAIGPSYLASRTFIREMRRRNIEVIIWNAGTKSEIERLVDFGVRGFVADDCTELKRIMEEIK